MPIKTSEDLLQHLQWAIEIEHSTIPPYLCALYSIKDSESPAARTIFSIVMEEMYHVALACNLLNAIRGRPSFDTPTLIQPYPRPIPHHTPNPPLVIHLQPCSIAVIQTAFMRIEQPEALHSLPQGHDYQTLGQFYRAVAQGFEIVYGSDEKTLFTGRPDKQLTEGYFGAYGQLFAVTDLASARQALQEIVDQGEGTSWTDVDDEGELAHYYKFKQIVEGTIALGEVWPMKLDSATAQLPPGPLRDLSQLFNDCYGLFLRTLDQVFNPPPAAAYDYRANLIYNAMLPLMANIMKPVAKLLLQTPIPGTNFTAGPSFEYSTVRQAQIWQNCQRLETIYPELIPVRQALTGLPVIDAL